MPSVRSEIRQLTENAAVLAPAFRIINQRAISANLGYHRYLWRTELVQGRPISNHERTTEAGMPSP